MGMDKERGRQVAYYTLWATQMRQWEHGADSDLIAYIRQRECMRTVKWLIDAGIVDMGDALHRFEVDHCKTAIQLIPHLDQVRPGSTTWAHKFAEPAKARVRKVEAPKARRAAATPPPPPPRTRSSSPPPVPVRARRRGPPPPPPRPSAR